MKKIMFTLTVITAVFACASMGFAANSSTPDSGFINITDSGAGPGIQTLGISAKSAVTYTATVNPATNICEMGVTSASRKASDDECIRFAVFGNQADGAPDDNNVYQRSAGGAPGPTTNLSWEDPTAANDWVIRGVGSVSTFAASNL